MRPNQQGLAAEGLNACWVNPTESGEGLFTKITLPLEGRPCGQPSSPVVNTFMEWREASAAEAKESLGVDAQASSHRGGGEPLL
jgi:hypothetical protein